MENPFEPFVDYGGPWVSLLAVLAGLAFAKVPNTRNTYNRLVKALSMPWLITAATCTALSAWTYHFGRLFLGDAYLRGTGKLPELSTILLGLVLTAVAMAWKGAGWNSLQKRQPWLTHALLLAIILSSNLLLVEAPDRDLAQGSDSRQVVKFVQNRLASLGCFEAIGKSRWQVGSFDALTASAVISFQTANDLVEDPEVDKPGEIAIDREFRILAHPFPFAFGPKRCDWAGEPNL